MTAGYDLLAETLVQRDAEIARLRIWLGESEMTVAKLRAALEAYVKARSCTCDVVSGCPHAIRQANAIQALAEGK